MTKPVVSIVSLAVGAVIGFLAANALQSRRAPEHPTGDAQHFYYRLNDTTIVRHTISGRGPGLSHVVDTIALQPR